MTLVGTERHMPYDKPPLFKQFLAGTRNQARVTLLGAREAEQDDTMLGLGSAAEELDVAFASSRPWTATTDRPSGHTV